MPRAIRLARPGKLVSFGFKYDTLTHISDRKSSREILNIKLGHTVMCIPTLRFPHTREHAYMHIHNTFSMVINAI